MPRSLPLSLSCVADRMTTTNQLQIVYGPRAGQPGQRIPYTIKTHMDLLVDNFGIAKVFGLTVKNDQIEVMPRVPDPVTGAKDTIWVGTNIIRPLDAICTYERNRFMRQLECKRKLEELGLTSPPTDSAKKKREAPVRAETPATHRDARPATEAARMREGPPPGAPSFDDATDPAPGNEPEKGEEEAEAEAGAEHEAEDETEEEAEANKSHKSAQAWFTRCMQEMRGEFDEMRGEMREATQSKRAGRPKTPAERRAATKAVRMARGFDWNDPALATDPVNVVQYKMQPWIAKGIEFVEQSHTGNLFLKNQQFAAAFDGMLKSGAGVCVGEPLAKQPAMRGGMESEDAMEYARQFLRRKILFSELRVNEGELQILCQDGQVISVGPVRGMRKAQLLARCNICGHGRCLAITCQISIGNPNGS